MRLYFIRHAQSENNHLWDTTGSEKGRVEDPKLTEHGQQQAEILAGFLHSTSDSAPQTHDLQEVDNFRITHIYCSLMVRAVSTATAVARALHLPLKARADLHEVGGIYLQDDATGQFVARKGKTRAFFAENYPDCGLPEAVTEEGWHHTPYEVPSERLPRAKRVWEDLLARHGNTDDHVAVVSHGAFYNYFMSAAIGLADPSTSPVWFFLNNASISRLDVREAQVGLVYSNRIDFLPRGLVT